jgi:hypothetical protein
MLPQGKHPHCNIWVLLLMSELYLVYSAIWEYYILPFHLFKFGVHTCRAGEPLSSLVSLLLARRLPHGHSSSLLAVSGREQLSVASRAELRSHGLLISTWTRYGTIMNTCQIKCWMKFLFSAQPKIVLSAGN